MVSARQVIDLAHLDRYTGGDRAINEEILQLFDMQCGDLIEKLGPLAKEAPDAKSWRQITHSLKGAARGIGAFSLGDAAAEAEKAESGNESAENALARLREDAAAVREFIANFLKNK